MDKVTSCINVKIKFNAEKIVKSLKNVTAISKIYNTVQKNIDIEGESISYIV